MPTAPQPLPSVRLGTSDGPEVAAQGLGCMRLPDAATADTVLGRALDLGVHVLDTALLYGDGENERLVGAAVRHRRAEAFLSTKFGFRQDPDNAAEGWGGWVHDGSPENAVRSCEASLARLGTDVIDLFYLHRRDPDVPIEESVGAMAELVTAGKVRHIGLSSVTAEELRAAHAVHPITALQSVWSLAERELEEEMLPLCVSLGVSVVPYFPLALGRFGGAMDDVPGPLAACVRDIAAQHAAHPGQIALAWVRASSRARGLSACPIPGTTRVPHLEQNVAALGVDLTPDQLAELDRVSRSTAESVASPAAS